MAGAKVKQRPAKSKAQKPGLPSKKKQHAFERTTIAVPRPDLQEDESEQELSEQDLDLLTQNAAFLNTLDQNGISKSKKEIERLHRLDKPARAKVHDSLPDVEEHTDDESPWEGGEVDEESVLSDELDDEDQEGGDSAEEEEDLSSDASDSDAEKSYELQGRKRRRDWEEEDAAAQAPARLPIKLANGQVKRLKNLDGRPVPALVESEESSSEEEGNGGEEQEATRTNNIATGSRFGRLAPAAVLSLPTRAERVKRAREQVASICQDIMADPENSLGLLRRLHTFTLSSLPSPDPDQSPVPNDPLIRKLTFLSLLSVIKDIVPSYRIRALTEKEQAENVSQMVMRTREWEQGLVGVYKAFLEGLEGEVKQKTELADVALNCLSTLLTDLTHFNFRTNIMSIIVARLSRKSWDANVELCRNTIVRVFKEDATGQASLELVRFLNRMIKERKFAIHPNVLSALLSLRLKTELGRPVGKEEGGRENGRKGKKEKKDKVHFSKKQKMAMKETREIQKEMAEAEEQVDEEDRNKTHTETLKLLFVLYFSILKAPSRNNRLLPEALAGISAFAHLINLDFFRDLLETLKTIIREADENETEATEGAAPSVVENEAVYACRLKLMCVVTAFQLLTGQGEALNIDLSEFVNHLYALLRPLAYVLALEAELMTPSTSDSKGKARPTASALQLSELLFRALTLLFLPRHLSHGTSNGNPAWRSAAFSKRLLTSALSFPAPSAIRAINFVQQLLAREPKLDALLSSEEGERRADGVYRPEVDDPQLSNPFAAQFWELPLLAEKHVDDKVREAARSLMSWQRT